MQASSSERGAASRSRGDWRAFRDRAYLRPYVAAVHVDEEALRKVVQPTMADCERAMKQLITRGVNHNEALLKSSHEFNGLMTDKCMAAVLERDRRIVRLADAHGAAALYAMRQLGILHPPWLSWSPSSATASSTASAAKTAPAAVRRAVDELASTLDATRATREYSLRSNVVRTQSEKGYTKTRGRPADYALPAVRHVLSAGDVRQLREGAVLVLDPNPQLLPPDLMAVAQADLMRVVRGGGGVIASANPCNKGSFHGMLPISEGEGQRMGLAEPTRRLIQQLAALPAIVERVGWPRKLALPAMVQLGFYPGGSGARYRPHLDRWASEAHNRRELTLLVYLNVGWDAGVMGGHLRLHPESTGGAVAGADGAGAASLVWGSERAAQPLVAPVDVAPLAGRVVIFQSGRQLHEVCESKGGHDRLAITLWVEYEEEWRGE